MRIAVLFHAYQTTDDLNSLYAISILADLWREDGHEVRFLVGCRDHWSADVAVVHVDLSRVPRRYIRFARRYPVVINRKILDIRKTTISRNLVTPGSGYKGPVIIKTDFNSAGIPEQKFTYRKFLPTLLRQCSFQTAKWPEDKKNYSVYADMEQIPPQVLARPGLVVEKFLPEIEGEWYFVRRCYGLGNRIISYRMGEKQPVVDAGDSSVFGWIENSPMVLAIRKELGLDYGVIDYTVHDGKIVILDITKTPGRGRPHDEAGRRAYDRILRHVAAGIYSYPEGVLE